MVWDHGKVFCMQKGAWLMEKKSDLSLFRNELKGLAILGVILCHMKLPLGDGLLNRLLFYGYSGVDVFLLLSGYGLYVSLSRSDDLGGYLRRRAARLLPAYWPVCLVWLCTMIPAFGFSPMQILETVAGNVLMVGFLAGAPLNINWYLSCLLLTLLLAPAIYACLKNSRRPLRTLFWLLAAAFGVGVSYFSNSCIMVMSRLPIFVLGMGLAMIDQGKAKSPLRGAARPAFLAFCFLLGLGVLVFVKTQKPKWLGYAGMYWYPFFLMIPPLCLGLGRLFRLGGEKNRLFAPLRMLGEASFEIFLFNVWIEVLVKKVWVWEPCWGYLWMGLLSIPLGLGWHWCVGRIIRKIEGRQTPAVS